MWAMTAEEREITEKLGWKIYEGSNYYEISQYSPAGEDFSITVARDEGSYAEELMSAYNCFDPDDHAAMWYGQNRGEPSSLRDLLDDAEAIGQMMEELATSISQGFILSFERGYHRPEKSASKCTKPMVKSIPKKAPSKKAASKCVKPKTAAKKALAKKPATRRK